jgi:hypothetical protein
MNVTVGLTYDSGKLETGGRWDKQSVTMDETDLARIAMHLDPPADPDTIPVRHAFNILHSEGERLLLMGLLKSNPGNKDIRELFQVKRDAAEKAINSYLKTRE